MNHLRSQLHIGVCLLGVVTTAWLLASTARAQAERTGSPKPELQTFPCKYIKAVDMARILREVLAPGGMMGIELARISVDERTNSVIVLAPPDELVTMKRLMSAVDIQQPGQARGEKQEVKA